MKEKLSLVIDAAVSGAQEIVSTTNATERLTQAINDSRSQVVSLNQRLKQMHGFESANKRLDKLAAQYELTKQEITKLDSALSENKQRTRALKTEYRDTQSELSQLNRALEKTAGEGAQELQEKVRQTRRRMASLKTEIHGAQVRTNELNAAFKSAQTRAGTLSSKWQAQQRNLGSLRDKLRTAGINTDHFADEQKKLEHAAERTTAALKRQNDRLKDRQRIQSRIDDRRSKLGEIGSQATGMAIAAAPLAGSMWAAIKNESSFADVKKVLNMSPEQSAQLRQWALRASATQMPMSADDVNAMLASGGQSGIQDPKELKQFVLDSAKMGVAFDMDARNAGDTLAVFKSSLGLDESGAMNLAGVSNYLSNNMNSRAGDIAAVMARQGATAKTAGFSVNDSAALASALLSVGMGEERSATAIKNISGRLTMGDAASGNQKEALAQLGFSAPDLASNMQQDASGTLLQVLGALKRAPKEQQSALISQIFGEEVKGAVATLAGNTQNLTKALKLANQSEQVHIQSLQQEYETRLATSENGIDMFMNKLRRLSIVIGEALLPALNWVLKPLGTVVDGIADFAEQNKGLTQILGIAAGGFVALKGALLAGKAVSLLFGNTMDKTRLFRRGLNRETRQGGRIAAYAARQWRSLNQAVANSSGPGGNYEGELGERKRRRSRRRRRRRGRYRRRRRGLSGLVMRGIDMAAQPRALGAAAGTGMMVMPNAGIAADVLDLGGEAAERFGKKGLGRAIKPLGVVMDGIDIAQGVSSGNMEQTGSAVGDIGGSAAGGAIGAAIGTAILPGIGTAVGGFLGSWLGGEGGSMIGSWFGKKLDSPEKTAAKVATVQHKEAVARQQPPLQFSPSFQIQTQPEQSNEAIAQSVTQHMDEQYKQWTGDNNVQVQMGYAAIDYDS